MNVEAVVQDHLALVVEKYLEAAQEFPAAFAAWAGGSDVPRVKVIYPAQSRFARTIADEFARVLRQELHADVEVVRASRMEDRSWKIHAPPWEAGFVGYVIDWGAVTTHTVRSLANDLAAREALAVHAIVLTSQLDSEAEVATAAVAAISPVSTASFASLLESGAQVVRRRILPPVPVRFEFLTEAHMGMYSGADCPLCHLARRLRRDTEEAPSRLLRDHASLKYELFRPRSRDEVLELPATDLLGSELTGAETLEIWRFRQNLASARTSTAKRSDVATALLAETLESAAGAWQARIRLLAAETYWLKLQPLDRVAVRQKLASVCLDILENRVEVIEFTGELRWQAAIILRASSKGRFLDRFGDEIARASNEVSNVCAELCYGMYTLLEAPYHKESRVLTNALAALQQALDATIPQVALAPTAAVLQTTLRSLFTRAITLQTELRSGNDLASAWHSLQNGYSRAMQTHAGPLTSMLVVLNALAGPGAAYRAQTDDKHPGAYWLRIRDTWEQCREFLGAHVFPYLAHLRDPLEALLLGGPARNGWSSLFELDSSRAGRFAEELSELAKDPDSFDEATRARLEREAFVWFDEILRGPQGSGAGDDGARLLRLIQSNPVRPASAWREAFDRIIESGEAIRETEVELDESLLVFCSRTLLVDALVQVIQNACKHGSADRTDAGPALAVEMTIGEGIAELTVRNDTSLATEFPGAGLVAYGERLSAFGGNLTHGPRVDQDWTYVATIRLPVWEVEHLP